jgi:hypothetical protein
MTRSARVTAFVIKCDLYRVLRAPRRQYETPEVQVSRTITSASSSARAKRSHTQQVNRYYFSQGTDAEPIYH